MKQIGHWINGREVAGTSGRFADVFNPATGEVQAQVALASKAELDAAAACGVLNTGGNVVGGIGALLVPVMVESLGWPAALAATSVFALIGAGLWLLIDAEQRDTSGPTSPLLTAA